MPEGMTGEQPESVMSRFSQSDGGDSEHEGQHAINSDNMIAATVGGP